MKGVIGGGGEGLAEFRLSEALRKELNIGVPQHIDIKVIKMVGQDPLKNKGSHVSQKTRDQKHPYIVKTLLRQR
jgi:hypothetical protein